MNFNQSTYPVFDFLELTEKPEPATSTFAKLNPLRNGAAVPEFNATSQSGRWHRFFNEITLDGHATGFSYERKPLLLYFYEDEWGDLSRQHLLQLNTLKAELRHYNVNVLVVTAQSLSQFKSYSWVNGLTLDVYEDVNNELSGLLQVHSNHSPAWDRYAGIEGNPALPGLFLLEKTRRIAFAFPNEELDEKLPAHQVLARAANAIWDTQRRSA